LIDSTLRCDECKGKKLNEIKEVIEVNVDKGMKDGEKITFYELGEQVPGALPGDLIVVLKEENASQFTRKGADDLVYTHKLSLSEALTGFEIAIQHLDGRQIVIKSNQIVKPGDIRVIEAEGMPVKRSTEKGRLYLKFEVIFPTEDQLPPANKKKLEALLPPKPKLPKFGTNDIVDEVTANTIDPMEEDNHHAHPNQQDEDDEESSSGQRGAQCVHQ